MAKLLNIRLWPVDVERLKRVQEHRELSASAVIRQMIRETAEKLDRPKERETR